MTSALHLVPERSTREVSDLRARDVMTTALLTVLRHRTIGEARALMLQAGVHHLPVIDGTGHCHGLLDVDLVEQAERSDRVGDVVTRRELLPLSPADSLRAVAAQLDDRGLDAAPVTTYDGRLVGLVTARDILAAVARHLRDNT